MDLFYRLKEYQRSLWLEIAPDFIRSASLDQSEGGKEYLKSLLTIPEVALSLVSFVSEKGFLIVNHDEFCSAVNEINNTPSLGGDQHDNAFWDSSEHPTSCALDSTKDGTLNEDLSMDLSSIDPFLRGPASPRLSPGLLNIPDDGRVLRAPPGLEDVIPIPIDYSQIWDLHGQNHHGSDECRDVNLSIGSILANDPTLFPTFGQQSQNEAHLTNGQVSSKKNPGTVSPPTAADNPNISGVGAHVYSEADFLNLSAVQTPTPTQACPWTFCPASDEPLSGVTLESHQDELHKEESPYPSFSEAQSITPSHHSLATVSQETIVVPPCGANGRIVCTFPGCSNKDGLKNAQTYKTHMRKHQGDAHKVVLATPPDTPPNQSPPETAFTYPNGQIMTFNSQPQYVAPLALKNADGFYECQYPGCAFVPFRSCNSYNRHCDSVHSGKAAECPYCARDSNGKGKATEMASWKKPHYYTRADAFQKHLKRIHPSIGKNHHMALEVIKRLRRGNGKGTTWDKTDEPAGKGFEGRDENGVLLVDPSRLKRKHQKAKSSPHPSKKPKLEKSIADHPNKDPGCEARIGNKQQEVLSYVEDVATTPPRVKAPLRKRTRLSSAVPEKPAAKRSYKHALDPEETIGSDTSASKKIKTTHQAFSNNYNLQEVAEYALAAAAHNTGTLTANVLQVPEMSLNLDNEDPVPYITGDLGNQDTYVESFYNNYIGPGAIEYSPQPEDNGGPSTCPQGESHYSQPLQYQAGDQGDGYHMEFYNPQIFGESLYEGATGESHNYEAEEPQAGIFDEPLDGDQSYLDGSTNQNERSGHVGLNRAVDFNVEYYNSMEGYARGAANLVGQNTPDIQVVPSPFIAQFGLTNPPRTYQEEIDGILTNQYQSTPINTNTFHHGLSYHIPSVRRAYEAGERRSVGWVNTSDAIFDPISPGRMNYQRPTGSEAPHRDGSPPPQSSHARTQAGLNYHPITPQSRRVRGRNPESMSSYHVGSMLSDLGYKRPRSSGKNTYKDHTNPTGVPSEENYEPDYPESDVVRDPAT